MKNIFTVLKLVAVGVFALAVTGCALVPPKETPMFGGMVWRATIVKQYVDSRKLQEATPERIAAVHFDSTRDMGTRVVKVQMGEGWGFGLGMVAVPDQVELSQLTTGTVVDVMMENPDILNWETQTYSRILRVVCDSRDSKCIDVEKEAKRYKAVVDRNPPKDISTKAGVTFNRRLSPEEVAEAHWWF